MVSCSQTTHVVGGLKMCNGKYHKVCATNFNMPVSDLFTGTVDYNDIPNGYVCTFCDIMDSTSRSLGMCNNAPGFEVAESVVVFWWQTGPGEYVNGNVCGRQCWVRNGYTFVNSGLQINVNIGSASECWRSFYQIHNMTGLDSDEVCIDGDYCAVTRATYVSGDDLSVGNCVRSMTWGGVPSTNRLSSDLRGSIWVEGNDLHFINANCWEHCLIGIQQSYVGVASKGAIWIDNSHLLHWVGDDAYDYKAKWRLCQFNSTFTNSAGPNPSPGSAYKGAIWADNEFGLTHLAYIGADGHKYIVGAGRAPSELFP